LTMRHLTIHRLYFTKNDCYGNTSGHPNGIQVHSTGANNPYLHRYVGPDDGLLGTNKYNNTWNQPGFNKCGNAFIGKLQNGAVAVYQTLPWETHCWLSGSWTDSKGNKDPNVKSANAQGFIGFEVCEDDRHNRAYFMDAVMDKSVNLCAYLCWKYGIDVNAVLDHAELHKLHMATDHGDITWWLKNYCYTMSMYRDEIRRAMAEGVHVTYIEGDKTWTDGPEEASEPTNTPTEETMSKQMIVTAETGKTVNLRSGPGTEYPKIDAVPIGTVVTETMQNNGWAYIQYGGKQGYMMEKFLAEYTPEPEPEPSVDIDAAMRYLLSAQANIDKALGILNSKG